MTTRLFLQCSPIREDDEDSMELFASSTRIQSMAPIVVRSELSIKYCSFQVNAATNTEAVEIETSWIIIDHEKKNYKKLSFLKVPTS